MGKNTAATAADVRAWFAENEDTISDSILVFVTKRGRLHPMVVETFNAESGMTYAEGNRPTVTLPYVKVSKAGARLKRTVDVPRPLARQLAGALAPVRGRLSKEAKVMAGARYAEQHLDTV